MKHLPLCAALTLALSACAPSGGGDTPSSAAARPATISGTLRPFTPGINPSFSGPRTLSPLARRGAEALLARHAGRRVQHRALNEVAPGGPPGPQLFPTPAARQDYVAGHAIVQLRDPSQNIPALAEHPGLAPWQISPGAWASPTVLALQIERRDGQPMDHAQTLTAIEHLREHPALGYAHPNFYKHPYARPSDDYYPHQWHLEQLGMEGAWALTSGDRATVCAVIDDGVNPHPDYGNRLLDGYDLISDPAIAGDGDARDGRPQQVPGSYAGQSVWHGMHVAGTMAAASDNNRGVTGMDWQCRILPVRVLGVEQPDGGAGTTIDVIAGIYWAAGLDVPGVPHNPHRAAVINLSLGGGDLIEAEQEAIDAATATGAVIVVAAGNSDEDAGLTSMAGYNNVIAVGAVDYNGNRAPYSNYGSVIDVMAPGGNIEADANGDGNPDGILSTYLNQSGNEPTYEFLQGTSMAAPHVAGLVALMKALDPELTPAHVEEILKSTADPSAQCRAGCGAGLINPVGALRAVGADVSQQPPTLGASAARMNLAGRDTGRIAVRNTGGGTLSWTASLVDDDGSVELTGRTRGELGPGETDPLAVRVIRDGLADGTYETQLQLESGDRTITIPVLFRVGAATLPDVGSVLIGTFVYTDDEQLIVGGETETGLNHRYAYEFTSQPGAWFVLAIADADGDEVLSDGDLVGFWQHPDEVRSIDVNGSPIHGIDFPLLPVSPDL
jgi:serine protease